jgi:hypothetical protein
MSTKGDFKAAEEDYRKALALQPKDSNAKTGLAIALISLNQTNDAISLDLAGIDIAKTAETFSWVSPSAVSIGQFPQGSQRARRTIKQTSKS